MSQKCNENAVPILGPWRANNSTYVTSPYLAECSWIDEYFLLRVPKPLLSAGLLRRPPENVDKSGSDISTARPGSFLEIDLLLRN